MHAGHTALGVMCARHAGQLVHTATGSCIRHAPELPHAPVEVLHVYCKLAVLEPQALQTARDPQGAKVGRFENIVPWFDEQGGK